MKNRMSPNVWKLESSAQDVSVVIYWHDSQPMPRLIPHCTAALANTNSDIMDGTILFGHSDETFHS